MKRMSPWLILLMLLVPVSLRAQGPIVAVFDMEDKGSGLGAAVLGNLTDYLEVLLTKGGYRVVPRTEIRQRLKAQKQETYKSCYDQSCQIELGRELAAEKTLATWILKIGKTCQVTATLYDLKKATTELAAAREASCDEGNLLLAVKAISDDLCKGLHDEGGSGDAEIKAAVARKEAEEARQEARRKAVELEKMRREAEAAKKRADEAEAARLAALQKAEELEEMRLEAEAMKKKAQEAEQARLEALQKVEELERTRRTVDSEELKKARLEAQLAQEKAKQAEAAKQAALSKTADLEQAKKDAEQARERAEQAEKEKKLAEAARLAAEQKAEQAVREAELARKHPEGRPTENFNLGVKIGFVAPDITDMKLVHPDLGERTGNFEGGFGATIDADFMLASFLSLGGRLSYCQGELSDPDNPNADDDYMTLHILSVFASLKGRLNLDPVEFRPGVAAGYQHLNSGFGKVHGLGLSAFVETAFYLGRHFALTVDLGLNIQPVGSGPDGDQTFTVPLLFVTLGAEYCD